MASTKYSYLVDDFINDKVDATRLTSEIRSSAIVTALDYVNSNGSVCDIWFKAELGESDLTTLSGIIYTHTGATSIVRVPTMSDGRPIVRSDTRPLGTQTFFTSAGDCPHLCAGTCPESGGPGRTGTCIGDGKSWMWDFSNNDDTYDWTAVENGPPVPSGMKAKIMHAEFCEEVYIKDGTLYFLDATFGSYLNMYITVPSGQYYPNPSGTIPDYMLGLPNNNRTYAQADGEVFYVAYVSKQYMIGDCPMGDELNAEASSVSSIPAGWYITGLVFTTADNNSFKGHGNLEMYRKSTAVLPGGALNGEYADESY